MTRLEDRQILLRDIAQARTDGARLASACALAVLILARCNAGSRAEGVSRGDRRPEADHPIPSHALSEAERARIIAVVNEPRFAETPPARIVPALADEGIYIASEFKLPSRAACAWLILGPLLGAAVGFAMGEPRTEEIIRSTAGGLGGGILYTLVEGDDRVLTALSVLVGAAALMLVAGDIQKVAF